MPGDSVDLSIVIVNWNTRDLLLDCLASISENVRELSVETIVVDNASSDGSAAAVRERFPEVRLIESPSNLGFAGANNLGIKGARGDLILFLNPDTVISDNSIGGLVAYMTNHTEVGAAGCRLLNEDGSVQTSFWMRFPSLGWLFMKCLYLDKLTRQEQAVAAAGGAPVQVAHLLGACIITRKSIVDRVGGFDESFFLYLEETDLCRRIHDLGHEIHYLPDLSIIHVGQQSSNQAAEWANTEFYLNIYRFLRRTHGSGISWKLAASGTIAIGALVRLGLWTIRLFAQNGQRRLAIRMLKGYWRLLWTVPQFERLCREGKSTHRKGLGNVETSG
jgi:GT2 family glycosyltransferase